MENEVKSSDVPENSEQKPLMEGVAKFCSSQQDSGYGSHESSLKDQSNTSSAASGSKSLNNGSSQGSIGVQNNRKNNSTKERKLLIASKKLTVKKIFGEPSNICKFLTNYLNENSTLKPGESLIPHPTSDDVSENINSQTKPQKEEDKCKEENSTTLVYNQALNYIRKIKERLAEEGIPYTKFSLDQKSTEKEGLEHIIQNSKNKFGFTLIISIQDGSVVYASSSITDILGFPKDMLCGQSFMNFVYPKDSISLSSKIINGLDVHFKSNIIKENYETIFFCRLLSYHDPGEPGFEMLNGRTVYNPCKIVFKSHESTIMTDINSSLLIAEVVPIKSVYEKEDEEISLLGSFSIRHTSTCNFSEYDAEAIPYLGHMPQDLTGTSIFDCYHPEDMKKMKNIYEQIIKHQGRPYGSEPYRFRTYNNSWVTLSTEWMFFVNPWTKNIESIIGKHRVIKPPICIDIFTDSTERELSSLSEGILLEAERAQNDILNLLMKPISDYCDPLKEPTVKRRRNLADYMSPFIGELDNIEKKNSSDNRRIISRATNPANKKAFEISLLGEPLVNPGPSESLNKSGSHYETKWLQQNTNKNKQDNLKYFDETPSSYGQLNYSAIMERYFLSNPNKILSDENDESKLYNSNNESLGITTSDSANQLLQSQSGSASGTGDNNFSINSFQKSNSKMKSNRHEDCSEKYSDERREYTLPLTREIMLKHNKYMEEIFINSQRKKEKNSRPQKCYPKTKILKKASKRTKNHQHILSRISKNIEINDAPPPKRIYVHTEENSNTSGLPSQKISLGYPVVSQKEIKPLGNTHFTRSLSGLSRSHQMKSEANPFNYQRTIPTYLIPNEPHISCSVGSGEAIGHSLMSSKPVKTSSTFGIPHFTRCLSGLSGNHQMKNEATSYSYQRAIPTYLIPIVPHPSCSVNSGEALGHTSMSSIPVKAAAPSFGLNHSTSMNHGGYVTQMPPTLPVQYSEQISPIIYPSICPSTFKFPAMMLPQLVVQPRLDQPPIGHASVSFLPKTKERGQMNKQTVNERMANINAKVDNDAAPLRRPDSTAISVKAELGSGRGSNVSASCKFHVPESLFSYIDETIPRKNDLYQKLRSQTPNLSQLSQFSSLASIRAEPARVKTPDKQNIFKDLNTKDLSYSVMISSVESYSAAHDEKQPDYFSTYIKYRKNNSFCGESENNLSHILPRHHLLDDSLPFWTDKTKIAPELLLRYQMTANELGDVLTKDMNQLKKTKQSSTIDHQLSSLYGEMEAQKRGNLRLEEGINSSSSDDQYSKYSTHRSSKCSRRKEPFFSNMSMLHEAEAPMPNIYEVSSST